MSDKFRVNTEPLDLSTFDRCPLCNSNLRTCESTPCPHEAEAKRLRRELNVAIASAKAMVANEMVARLEIIYKEETIGCTEREVAIMTRFMGDFRSLARENREALEVELRRRSGE